VAVKIVTVSGCAAKIGINKFTYEKGEPYGSPVEFSNLSASSD
jgi:hypothetical protein